MLYICIYVINYLIKILLLKVFISFKRKTFLLNNYLFLHKPGGNFTWYFLDILRFRARFRKCFYVVLLFNMWTLYRLSEPSNSKNTDWIFQPISRIIHYVTHKSNYQTSICFFILFLIHTMISSLTIFEYEFSEQF